MNFDLQNARPAPGIVSIYALIEKNDSDFDDVISPFGAINGFNGSEPKTSISSEGI